MYYMLCIFRCAVYIRCAVPIQQVRENGKILGARYTKRSRYRRENTVITFETIHTIVDKWFAHDESTMNEYVQLKYIYNNCSWISWSSYTNYWVFQVNIIGPFLAKWVEWIVTINRWAQEFRSKKNKFQSYDCSGTTSYGNSRVCHIRWPPY
jgi:hypothetical protein